MRPARLVFGMALLGGQALAASGPYGAIAYAEADDNVYVVTDYDSRVAATSAALAKCQAENAFCTVPLWFMNTCGAFAKGGNGAWGTGWGQTQEIATSWAVKTCADYGGVGCRLKIVMCSPGGAGYIPKD